MHWIKLEFSTDISMTIDWVGDLFCSDKELSDISPSVAGSTFKDDWESGKTDWEEQRVTASDLIIGELRGVNLNNPNMLLDKAELSLPTVYRTLALIYSEMGDTEKVDMYMKSMNKLLKQSFSKDMNLNGRIDPDESTIRLSTMVR